MIYQGDCRVVLPFLADNSVDAIVTDPPYGLGKEPDALEMLRDWLTTGHHTPKSTAGFMGKAWDAFVPQPAMWAECLRVLKPGGHVLAFAGTRTQDLMALGLRIAGFEIRDLVAWVYGQGFPKSLDVSKAIDKEAGAERDVIGMKRYGDGQTYQGGKAAARTGGGIMGKAAARGPSVETAPATDAARQWQGWGTALKPALEPITLARKPLAGTVAANVLQHGTGALNIDGCRVGTESTRRPINNIRVHGGADGAYVGQVGNRPCDGRMGGSDSGRWPANLIHDGSDEVLAAFPAQAGGGFGKRGGRTGATVGDYGLNATMEIVGYGDTGSAARFFYCAKASKADRGDGNIHPTVKPTELMRYLCRLITPPGGTVLDPFMGSGTTGKAAALEGFQFIGIELNPEYVALAKRRLADPAARPGEALQVEQALLQAMETGGWAQIHLSENEPFVSARVCDPNKW